MLKHYLTTALRNFRRHWITTGVNVVGLALGLACFIGVLSAVHYFKLDDAHFTGSDRTYLLARFDSLAMFDQDASRRKPIGMPMAPYVAAEQVKADMPELEAVARVVGDDFETWVAKSIVLDGRASNVVASFADAAFLKLFPLTVVAGDPAALSQPQSAVLTDATALRIFGTTNVTGRHLLFEGSEPITIVAVVSLPTQPSHIVSKPQIHGRYFEMLVSIDVLETLTERDGGAGATARLRSWGPALWSAIYIKLPSDGSIDIATVNSRLAALLRRSDPGPARMTLGTIPVAQYRQDLLNINSGYIETGVPLSTLLLGVAGAILLLACLNYANLATAISVTHVRELGVRRVLGASAIQLVTQVMTEGVLLTLTALGLALAFVALLAPVLEHWAGVSLTYAWLHSDSFWLEALSLALGTALIASVIPAVATVRLRPGNSLRTGSRGMGTRASPRWLVGAQFLLTSALLIVALVVARQQRELVTFAHNTTPDSVVVIRNDLRKSGVNFATLRSELLRQPHVQSVSSTNILPWQGPGVMTSISPSGDATTTEITIMAHFITHDYFSSMQIDLLAGSVFDPASDLAAQRGSIVIDRSTARRLGFESPQAAVGKTIYRDKLTRSRNPTSALHIIGVVEDRLMSFRGRGPSNIYFGGAFSTRVPIVKLAPDNVAAGTAELNTVWAALAPNHSLRSGFLSEAIDSFAADQRTYSTAIDSLALLALAISLTGLLGMSIHMANRRQHEIGVRKTLGARQGQIVRLLLHDFTKPVLIGSVAGWPLAFIIAQAYLEIYSRRIDLSPGLFAGAVVVSMTVACAAVMWCAVQSSRLRPADVLRHE